MKDQNPFDEILPDRYTREFEYQKEAKINVRMTKELHKDIKRILVEQDESWQSMLEELVLFFALTHQDQLPSEIRALNLSQTPAETDKQLKSLAKSRLETFNEYRPVREPF